MLKTSPVTFKSAEDSNIWWRFCGVVKDTTVLALQILFEYLENGKNFYDWKEASYVELRSFIGFLCSLRRKQGFCVDSCSTCSNIVLVYQKGYRTKNRSQKLHVFCFYSRKSSCVVVERKKVYLNTYAEQPTPDPGIARFLSKCKIDRDPPSKLIDLLLYCFRHCDTWWAFQKVFRKRTYLLQLEKFNIGTLFHGI